MAIPPVLIGAVGTLVTNPKVQKMAGKLANNVYGRIIGGNKKSVQAIEQEDSAEISDRELLQEISRKLDDVADKSELAEAFAFLQADLDQRHHRQKILTTCFGAANLVLIALLAGVVFFG
ncbi:hypothetical protein [Parasphingorhabdus sp.]|uniref:hypothetical protein n=1 Tax=Parasphingorhabdus sp. TaxID=2709688 RepID=UPI00359411BB